jgi:hypothetical protein
VWARDRTASFSLPDQDAIGPDGALILPKLFRRCTDYLRGRSSGQTLPDWLRADPAARDDEILLDGRQTRLSARVDQDAERILFGADLLRVVFIGR